MTSPALRVKIYGVRGSYNPTDGKATKIGANTTCIRIDLGHHIIVFDAGSGIINCGRDIAKQLFREKADQPRWKTHLFFTHLHIDHLAGFPYYALLYLPKSEIHFFAPRILDYTLENILNTFTHPPFFPVSMNELPFEGHFNEIAEDKAVYFYKDGCQVQQAIDPPEGAWQGRISCMRNYLHPKGGSYFYKVETRGGKKVVLASDTEGFVGGDQRLIKFAGEADLLFHDAQYTLDEYQISQGFGHSTYEMACKVAQDAGVKKLLLTHHDPNHDDEALKDIERKAQKLFRQTAVAAENMEFTF